MQSTLLFAALLAVAFAALALGGTPPPTTPPCPTLPPVPCPPACLNGGVDADGDCICDSGFPTTCCCGANVGCNDNALNVSNSNQHDYDCDCRGNVVDGCPDTYNPVPVDADGDGLESVCDCDDTDRCVPKHKPCLPLADRPVSSTLLMWLLIGVGFCVLVIIVVAVIVIARARPSAAAYSGLAPSNDFAPSNAEMPRSTRGVRINAGPLTWK